MNPFRYFLPIALVLAATGAAGCKEDPPAPRPEMAREPASSAVPTKGKVNLKTPLGQRARVDPQAMKDYRLEVCYFGTLTLKQARDTYLASLGKDEPSEKKIPSFGGNPAPAAPSAPGAPGGAKAAPAAQEPMEKGSSLIKPEDRRPFNIATRAPHERNARSCTVAVGLKDPPMPGVDAMVAEFAPYAVELSKNIGSALNYYQREEYKKDGFEKGKELHKKLIADFEKLDGLSDKLGAAVAAWRKEHPVDLSTADEGQKAAIAALDDARAVTLGVLDKKVDLAANKEALTKLEASVGALKAHGAAQQTDPWSKIMSPSFDAFLRAMKDAEPKLTDKGISDPELFLSVVSSFTSVIEARHRALTRWLIAQGQTQERQLLPHVKPTGPAADQEGKQAP